MTTPATHVNFIVRVEAAFGTVEKSVVLHLEQFLGDLSHGKSLLSKLAHEVNELFHSSKEAIPASEEAPAPEAPAPEAPATGGQPELKA